nr:DUF2798 domain-containing protein [Paenibacillus turpanensis]
MCALMVLGMSFYNMILMQGFTGAIWLQVAAGYVPGFIVALILDVFVVGKIAKGLTGKLVKPSDPLVKRIMFMSVFMVTGMVFFMSAFGALMQSGFSASFLPSYGSLLWKNFICALPLQLLIVGPITRVIFMRLYPPHAAPQLGS